MTSNKYQCLVDALGNSGIPLPSIKEGAEVEELSPRPNLAYPPPNDEATFFYRSAAGTDVLVTALDGITGPNRWWDTWGRTKDFSVAAFGLPKAGEMFGTTTGIANSVANSETGAEGTPELNLSPKPGTVGETVDKILKCRDPAMS
jgi:hypothetical protein